MANVWSFVNFKSFSKQVTDSWIVLKLRIAFLKPYNLTLFIDLSAETAQLSIAVCLADIWSFGFHQGMSPRTGERIKCTLLTSVREHMLNYDHTVACEGFSIIGRNSNYYVLETKANLFIKRENPSLNKDKYSQKLFLF